MEFIESLKGNLFAVRLSASVIILLISYYLYRRWINGNRYKKQMDSLNKVVIITGASKGIGKKAALNLAWRGAHIIIACRDIDAGNHTKNEIIQKTNNPNITCKYLNLGSFQSIRQFVNDFLKTESRLDILINNASVYRLKREITDDGLEQMFGINYMGHFLLTILLMPRLLQSKPSRIVNISHWIHRYAEIDQMDLMCERNYCSYVAYARSQLAIMYFTHALSIRLSGSGVNCNALHPGVSLSGFFRRLDDTSSFYLPKWLLVYLSQLLCKSENVCAEHLMHAAFDFNLQNVYGAYCSNTKIDCAGENSENIEMMEWLWKKSEGIIGVKFNKSIINGKKATTKIPTTLQQCSNGSGNIMTIL